MLGLLDRSAWWLAAEGQQQRVSYGAVLLVAAAALRGVLPMLLSHRQEMPGIGKTVMLTLASLLGLALAFCLAAWWIGVVYAAVLLPVFTPAGLDFMRGWAWLGTIAVIIGVYALATGRNFAFLNASSLHMFYKARIVRGYLGAANARRLGAQPTDKVSGLEPPQVPVGEVDAARRHLAAALRAAGPRRAGAPGERLHQPDARHQGKALQPRPQEPAADHRAAGLDAGRRRALGAGAWRRRADARRLDGDLGCGLRARGWAASPSAASRRCRCSRACGWATGGTAPAPASSSTARWCMRARCS